MHAADWAFFPPRRAGRATEFDSPFPCGWTFDVANFRTAAKNCFDHDVLGNSNIFSRDG